MSELCEYYQRVVDKLNIYVPGSANVYSEGSVPAKYLIKKKPSIVRWRPNRINTVDLRFSRPIIFCAQDPCPCGAALTGCVSERWQPGSLDVSPRLVRENRRPTATARVEYCRSSRTVEESTLTEMMPPMGMAVPPTPVPWGSPGRREPPPLTNLEPKDFRAVNSEATAFADAYTKAQGYGLYM